MRSCLALPFIHEDIAAAIEKNEDSGVENPIGSAIWSASPLSETRTVLKLKQHVGDHCPYGACNEMQEPIRKRSRYDARWRLRHATRQCACVVPHGQLSSTVDGIARTAKAAVYPVRLCEAFVKDFVKVLMNIKEILKIN